MTPIHPLGELPRADDRPRSLVPWIGLCGLLALGLLLVVATRPVRTVFLRCTGAGDCTACETCSSCAHCRTGSCGVKERR